MLDYQQLLKKYMNHVGEEEGIHFIPQSYDKAFTDEERQELENISEEIWPKTTETKLGVWQRPPEYSKEVKRRLLEELMNMSFVKKIP